MKIWENNIFQKIVYGVIIFFGSLVFSKLGSLLFVVKNINNVENMYIDSGIVDILVKNIRFINIITFIIFMIAIISYHAFIRSINNKKSNNSGV